MESEQLADCWRTPTHIWQLLLPPGCALFCYDAAARSGSAIDGADIPDRDGLAESWHGRVWCNPPYSNIGAWVEKAAAEFGSGNAASVTMLLPSDRHERQRDSWWWKYVEQRRDVAGGRVHTVLLPFRVAFLHPLTGKPVSGARFGCVAVHFGEPSWRQAVLRRLQ